MDMSKFEAKRVFETPKPRKGQIFWTQGDNPNTTSALCAVNENYQFDNSDLEEILEKFKTLEYGQSFLMEGTPSGIVFTLRDQQTLAIRLQGTNSECQCHPAEFLSITENRIKESQK